MRTPEARPCSTGVASSSSGRDCRIFRSSTRCGRSGGSTALHELPVQLRELPRLLPDLAGRGSADEVDQTRDDSRLRLFEEVLAVLEHLSRAQPLVLVLEDLQWADVSTLDLVAFLAHAVRDRRILVVATYRSEEFRTGNPLHRLVGALVTAGVVDPIELGPLVGAEVEALLAAAGAQLSPEVTEAIVLRSEGNPFFARELQQPVHATGRRCRQRCATFCSRASRVSTPMPAAVLRVAAAAGRDVPYRLLAAVTPLHELELADALRQAVEYDVLAADQAAGTFRFRHELFAEAVYSTLLPGEREVLHERLARAITEEPGLAVSGATAAEAAQHWAAAGRPIEALAASLQAARDAEVVSGLTEALQHVERVLELWDRVPLAEELAGVALPAVIAWAVDLAGVSAHHDEVDARKLIGALVPDQSFDVHAVAAQLGVSAEAAATTLGRVGTRRTR
jgi:Predicted ATPase